MKTLNNKEYENAKNSYENEVKEKWGHTDAYKQSQEKTAGYSQEKQSEVNEGLMAVFAEFAKAMNNGLSADSDEAVAVAEKLQAYITENFYTCTNEILSGLGEMYVLDERFKENIDKYGKGTAEYARSAIKFYCNQ
ncbi:MAG: TipAS antibiotic-recognition domain-containing protein [Clostridia bacterium]|nr:TipAS antibiotic-recognition domain-containing protein [Clostridia bacterium]